MVDHGIPWSSDHHFHLGPLPGYYKYYSGSKRVFAHRHNTAEVDLPTGLSE